MQELKQERTFKVGQHGNKFTTIARIDGFWVATWYSKRRKTAQRKGAEFIAGQREPGKIAWCWDGVARINPFIAFLEGTKHGQ